MHSVLQKTGKTVAKFMAMVLPMLVASYAPDSLAIPAFARQTGQNCVACHAGGQFPELTPYGRLFKLTGYTIGERNVPISAMAVVSYTKTRNTNDPNGNAQSDFPKNSNLALKTESIFLGGKITDNIGAFIQLSNDQYDHQDGDGSWKSKAHSDNFDLRYADHFIDINRDLIFGITANNNPSVQDVWNSAPAWGFNVVPGSLSPLGLPSGPQLAGGLSQQVAGLGAYVYWNKLIYAEVSAYRTANKSLAFMSQGFKFSDGSMQRLSGIAPYWRLALTKEWGAHNAMIGLVGLTSKLHNDPNDPTSPTTRYADVGIDGQYQYLLNPHTVTAQFSYIHERIGYDSSVAGQPGNYDEAMSTALQPLTNSTDTLDLFQAKASYIYRATYGGSLAYFNLRGSYNSAVQQGVPGDLTQAGVLPSVAGTNVTGKPDTAGWITEAFWIPVQYARVGIQYSMFSKYLGASKNYDGYGRDAKDNNTLFLYFWGAY
jgi:hypothetical protein